MEKQFNTITPDSLREAGTVCMVKVESSKRCKYYSEDSYRLLILILLIRKKLGLAIVGHNRSGGPCDGLALN